MFLDIIGDSLNKEFKLSCKVNNGADGIGFDTPNPWPLCKDPPIIATVDPDASSTSGQLKPCQCLGEIPVKQAKTILDKFCRNNTIEGNTWIFKSKNLGGGVYEGYTPPSRKRCGSRNPEDPDLKDHCFCSAVEQQSSNKLWQNIYSYKNIKLINQTANKAIKLKFEYTF